MARLAFHSEESKGIEHGNRYLDKFSMENILKLKMKEIKERDELYESGEVEDEEVKIKDNSGSERTTTKKISDSESIIRAKSDESSQVNSVCSLSSISSMFLTKRRHLKYGSNHLNKLKSAASLRSHHSLRRQSNEIMDRSPSGFKSSSREPKISSSDPGKPSSIFAKS
jgi:hypothetical protein